MTWLFTYVEGTVLAVCLLIIAYIAAAESLSRGSMWPAISKAIAGIVWFVAIFELARHGAFEGRQPDATTYLLGAAVVPLIGAALWGLTGRWHTLVNELPRSSLVAVQTYRLMGVVFFLALAGDAIPTWLGVWGGSGEMAIGLSAPVVALIIAKGEPRGLLAAKIWNVVGVLELVGFAIAIGLSARTAAYFLTVYPLVLFTVFIVPMSVVIHLGSLLQLTTTEA